MALYEEHECPLIWSWQRDRAGPAFLSWQNTPPHWHSCLLCPSSLCRYTALRSREGPSCEVPLIGNAAIGVSCSLLQRDGPFLPSEGQWVFRTCDIGQGHFLPQSL